MRGKLPSHYTMRKMTVKEIKDYLDKYSDSYSDIMIGEFGLYKHLSAEAKNEVNNLFPTEIVIPEDCDYIYIEVKSHSTF